ncbi:MAG TPA: CopD family protein [Rubrobacteraceae bacterium]|nr:CopD family protein [Rubrobacteraceae bacterium]
MVRQPAMRRLSILLELTVMCGLVFVWFPDIAYAQGHGHGGGVSLSRYELLVGFAHAVTLGATVFLAGLVAFAALVWVPASRESGVDQTAASLLNRGAWAMFALLIVAGLIEVSLYAVRASGESFSLGLLLEAWFGTRVGHIWLARLGFALITVLVSAWAVRERKTSYWWVAACLGAVLLMTLTQLSHAAAEGRLLPFAADWLHVIAASVWMGGLLGFPLLLLGPLRAASPEIRAGTLGRTVRRFSKVATVAVSTIVLTGVYASLLHVPSLAALVSSSYGRALVMKLGLAMMLLATGGINLIDKGQGPFDRMIAAELLMALGVFAATGFLSSLPPP